MIRTPEGDIEFDEQDAERLAVLIEFVGQFVRSPKHTTIQDVATFVNDWEALHAGSDLPSR